MESSDGIDHLWADGMSAEGEEQMAKATHIPKDAHSTSVQRAMEAVKPVPLVESNAKRNVGFDNIFEAYRKAGDKTKKLSCEEMRASGAAFSTCRRPTKTNASRRKPIECSAPILRYRTAGDVVVDPLRQGGYMYTPWYHEGRRDDQTHLPLTPFFFENQTHTPMHVVHRYLDDSFVRIQDCNAFVCTSCSRDESCTVHIERFPNANCESPRNFSDGEMLYVQRTHLYTDPSLIGCMYVSRAASADTVRGEEPTRWEGAACVIGAWVLLLLLYRRRFFCKPTGPSHRRLWYPREKKKLPRPEPRRLPSPPPQVSSPWIEDVTPIPTAQTKSTEAWHLVIRRRPRVQGMMTNE